MENDNDYLIHYGVLGMKWGVRKQRRSSRNSLGKRIGKKIKTKASEAYSDSKKKRKAKKREEARIKKLEADRKKPISHLTDAELNRRIARLELEKKYKDLSRTRVSTGSRIMNEIMTSSAKNIGGQVMTYELGTLVNKLAKSEIVNPKKGQRDKK